MIEASDTNVRGGAPAQVRELVVQLLGTGRCTVDVVAQHLGVDRRTIHRRLAADDQTYSDIVEAVRRELADRYLADQQRSLAQISSLLGFAAPSGFSRWHRRHFGVSASELRSRSVRAAN